jgi:hypothetical protein
MNGENVRLLVDAEIEAGVAAQALRDLFHREYHKSEKFGETEIAILRKSRTQLENSVRSLNQLLTNVKFISE